MKIAPEVIAALCRTYGAHLLTPVTWQGTPLDKVRLLWGIAGVESTFGAHCNPRHEQGYCYRGRYFDESRTAAWGCLAHCSYGPWQVMFSNFPVGVSPLSLMWDTDGRVAAMVGMNGAIDRLNSIIARGAKNLDDIALHYNGPDYVDKYAAQLSTDMNQPMPETPATVNA